MLQLDFCPWPHWLVSTPQAEPPKPGTQKAKCWHSTSTEALSVPWSQGQWWPVSSPVPWHLSNYLSGFLVLLPAAREDPWARGRECATLKRPSLGGPAISGGLGWEGMGSDCKDAMLLRGSPSTIKDYQLNKTRSDWGHYALLD